MMRDLKQLKVVCAVIMRDGKILATQRGYGEYKDGWEFPGGKVEETETPEEAILREIREEMNIGIRVIRYLNTVEYDYPKFHLSMDCFLCEIKEGEPELREHEALRWLTKESLYSVDWLPADRWLVENGVSNQVFVI